MNEQAQNFNQAILMAMNTFAERVCFQFKQDKRYKEISYRQFEMLALRAASFFRQQGITNEERLAIICHNSLEWMISYMACLLAGGVVVPLPTLVSPDTLRLMLQDSGARLVVVQDGTVGHLIQEMREALPDLQSVLVVDDLEESQPGVTAIGDILANPLTGDEYDSIRTQAENVEPHALAAIHYTVRETVHARGAVFDHAQRLLAMQHIAEWFTFDEDDLAITILPWSHIASLDATLHYFLSGITNVQAESGQVVFENMRQTSPTLILTTPYAFEYFFHEIVADMSQLPESSREVFHWALTVGKEYRTAGSTASQELRERFARADMTFFSQIRGKIGGRMRQIYSTGAPLSQELADFVEAIGLLPLHLYNFVEAGGFPAVSRPGARRPGSCGQAAPGYQLRIADDGEVLVKGPTAMREYWQNPEKTQEIIDSDGWLHTDDLGYIDQDGYLYITGHKHARIALSTGQKVTPTIIESALTASPFIAQAAVFGEGRPYVSAIIVPDLEALAGHFQDEATEGDDPGSNAPDSPTLTWFWQSEHEDARPVITMAHPRVKAQLDQVVEEVNNRLDKREQIRNYSLLEQAFSKGANELDQLLQTARQEITKRYASQIEAMYPRTPQIEEKEITQVQVSPERLRELLEKESILDAWMADAGIEFLFELARHKQIDTPSLVHICDTVASIAQMESEEKPLSTALIVGDPARIARVLPASQIQLLRQDHIRRMRAMLITLAKMVDGLVLGYVVDRHGYVRGIYKLNVEIEQSVNLLLGPQFRRHAAISGQCDALVFFVPTGGRQVRVFAHGQLIGRYSNGDWSPENMPLVNEVIAQLAEQKNYDLALIRRVLRCAFQMSEENLGGIFIVGNADNILKHSDAPEISPFASIVSAEVKSLSDRELINFAKQDGATVVDVQGKFQGCMVLLRPGVNTRAEIGPGKGARHSSAAKMSAEAQCLAITVSQDGPITIYDSGRRVLSL